MEKRCNVCASKFLILWFDCRWHFDEFYLSVVFCSDAESAIALNDDTFPVALKITTCLFFEHFFMHLTQIADKNKITFKGPTASNNLILPVSLACFGICE